MKNRKYDIFISYRRDGGEYTAKLIRDRLTELGYRVFFDVEALRSGDFNTKLYDVIDECKDYLVVLSPGSLDRCVNEGDWVRREIEHALEKGKNVVPLLLRGFQFPDELPESIEPIRFRNGLESNTQFFDAFIGQLCQKFLRSKPRLKSVFSRRKGLTLAALLAAAALIFGAVRGVRQWQSIYPRSTAEKNTVEELLHCAGLNLTYVNVTAQQYQDALQAAKRYVIVGEKDAESLEKTLRNAYAAVENTGIDAAEPTEHLLSALESSPISVADVSAMYQETEGYRERVLGNLATVYGYLLGDGNAKRTAADKLQTLELFEALQTEEMQYQALCANALLGPIQNSALTPLWQNTVPVIGNIPLNESTWQTDQDAIKEQLEACMDRYEKIVGDIVSAVK